jgi:hypothetical protein
MMNEQNVLPSFTNRQESHVGKVVHMLEKEQYIKVSNQTNRDQ